jgi:uncharacterized protein
VRGVDRLGVARLALGWLVLCWVFAAGVGAAAEPAPEPVPQATIVVFGDSQAAGLARGLQRVLIEDSRYRILNRTHAGAALVHAESEWLAPIQRFVEREKADIAIVMFGANDRLDFRERGAYLRFRSDEWRDAYAERTRRVLQPLTAAGLKVIWCGNPIARSDTYSNDMSYINDIYVDETVRFGAKFVPLWSAFADAQGRYSAYGKDHDGVTQRLRADDGIHFTGIGYELIAEKLLEMLPPADPTPR